MAPLRNPAPLPLPDSAAGQQPSVQSLSRAALSLHQRGQLQEAERLYRQILAIDPQNADGLHLLGALAHQVGKDEMAIELIGKAIASDRRQATYHSNLGTALQAQGRMEEAAASYQRALALKPDFAEAHMNLGAVLEAMGRKSEAEARFRRALAIKPGLAEAHVNLGNVLLEQGKLDEAAACQEQALALQPQLPEAHFHLANVRQAQGRLDEAVGQYEKALELRPGSAEILGNLGNTLLAQKKLESAVACYDRALELKPEFAEVCYNLGNARQEQHKLEEAVACYERALALKPLLPEAHYNLGNALYALERLDEARSSFELAIALRPHYAEAQYNLGCVLQDMGKQEAALERIELALALKPEYPQARFALALARLKNGEFAEGWQAYESRWASEDHNTPDRHYPWPRWNGDPLGAGRLLLWGEQGVGDEIQFASMIPDLVRAGQHVVLDCDPRLKPLFQRSFPRIEVRCCDDAPVETLPGIAAHLPTGSLPRLYRVSELNFSDSPSPYLKADPARRAAFRERYYDGRKLVGLAWRTTNAKTGQRRSVSLAQLAPLFALPDVRWISLQYGDFDALEAQAEAAEAPLRIDRDVDQMRDMDGFAAQIAAMDRVICIDNSTAHLAGALGVPVWTMLPFAADWRWMMGRSYSPWYPSLRLFRQPRRGAWEPVIDAVRQALAAECAGTPRRVAQREHLLTA